MSMTSFLTSKTIIDIHVEYITNHLFERLLRSQPSAHFALENFTIDGYLKHVSQSVDEDIIVNVANNRRCSTNYKAPVNG